MKNYIYTFYCLLLSVSSVFAQSKMRGVTDSYVVLGLVNVPLSDTTEKHKVEPTMLVVLSPKTRDVEVCWLDARYEYDLHSIQYGDTLNLTFSGATRVNSKVIQALDNKSLNTRMAELKDRFIDIDFWAVKKRVKGLPTFDDGLVVNWLVARDRFLQSLAVDEEGYQELLVDDFRELKLSERLFTQLYNHYVASNNETIRRRSVKP